MAPADGGADSVAFTLREMAWGGICDQAGGGFARYAVDVDWLFFGEG